MPTPAQKLAAVTGAFSPLDYYANVVAWNSALVPASLRDLNDDEVVDGVRVAEWHNLVDPDVRLYASLTEVTAPWRPILRAAGFGGAPTVDFSEGTFTGLFAEVSDAGTSWTITAVVDSTTTSQVLLDIESGRLMCLTEYAPVGGGGPGWFDGAFQVIGDARVDGRQILTWVFNTDDTSAKIYRGTDLLGTGVYNPKAMTATLMLGRRQSATTAPAFVGFCSELIIAKGAQDPTDIYSVVRGLSGLYGLAIPPIPGGGS